MEIDFNQSTLKKRKYSVTTNRIDELTLKDIRVKSKAKLFRM